MFQVKFDEENKVWDSCHVPLVLNDKISIGHALLRSMLLNGPKIAQISDDTGEQLTFEELRLRTIRSAQNLQKRGIKTNQVIGIMVENVVHLAPIVSAALCLGCPINALNCKAEKIDFIRMFRLTEPSMILCDVNMYELVVESLGELGIDAKIFTCNGAKGIAEPVESLFEETGNEDDFVPAEIDAEKHIAALMKSSGTTGQFKGITISHASLISSACSFNVIDANDICFIFVGMHWVCGLLFLVMGTINGATRIITGESFSPERQVHIMEKYRVTFTFVGSFYLVQILKSGLLAKADLLSVKKFFIAGSRVPLSIRNDINFHLPNGKVYNSYGMTELGSFLTAEYYLKHTDKDTVGALLNGYKIKVVDENGNRCGVDVDGEIYIKGRYEFLGYYKNDKLTKQTLDEEGFFMTGDIGHIDKDGFVYIVDRKTDVIHYDSRISPSDIEAVLLESPDIAEACAVGVPHNPVIDFPAVAVIRAMGSTISESDVSNLVTDRLGQYCKLRGGVYFVESLPKTASGKTLRAAVKERIAELYKFNPKDDDYGH